VNVGLQSMSYPDPNNFLDYCPGEPQAAFVAYQDDKTKAICDQARQTVDDKKRKGLFYAYQNRLNASSPFMPIMQPPAILVGSCALTGIAPNGIWNLDVAKIGENASKC
jgi:peptide/nickel transport system substrate-binding protein